LPPERREREWWLRLLEEEKYMTVPEEPSPSKLASFSNINFLSLVGIITALEWWIGHERKGDPNVHNVFKGIWDHM
jgi:hypothetical protein